MLLATLSEGSLISVHKSTQFLQMKVLSTCVKYLSFTAMKPMDVLIITVLFKRLCKQDIKGKWVEDTESNLPLRWIEEHELGKAIGLLIIIRLQIFSGLSSPNLTIVQKSLDVSWCWRIGKFRYQLFIMIWHLQSQQLFEGYICKRMCHSFAVTIFCLDIRN